RQTSLSIVAGTLDKLVYQLVLMHDLRDPSKPLHYVVADDGRIKNYQLVREGEETLEILGAPTATLRVVYSASESPRRTTLWCAPRFDYLPVKIEYREDDGNVTTATLTEVRNQILPAPNI
ncbi:MAG: DUF3108 domain-containing protein, partial [Gammaproteobacteria bacterium]